MKRAVFIDWDDTLGDWQKAVTPSQKVLYEKYRIGEWCPDFDVWCDMYRTHNQDLWERYGRSEITKDFLYYDQFLHPICQLLGLDTAKAPGQLVDMSKRMGDDFLHLTNEHFSLLPGAEEMVKYLSGKYPLTVVSNGFMESQFYKLEHSALLPYFAHVVLSEDVGVQKPDPYIYEVALQKNKQQIPDLQKEEVIMIGDSYTSDIAGAKAAGIDSIWIVGNCTPTEQQRKDATYVVSSLQDVRNIL